jgi:hypothetical protein
MGIRIRIPSPGMTRFAALVILFGAILPQVLYVGHWPVPGVAQAGAPAVVEHTHGEGADHHGTTGGEHELHCHAGPAKCGGPQSMVASMWIGEDAGLLAFSDTPRISYTEAALPSVDPLVALILQPPQTTS